MHKADLPVTITDVLGIPPHEGIDGPWLSNEGTVIKEWFQAVAELHGLPYIGKVRTMQRILEHYGVAWDAKRHSSTERPAGGGGNVRKEAFADLLVALERDPRHRALAAVAAGTPFVTDPDHVPEDDERVMRAIRTRRGQPQFRQSLLAAYEGRCALTGCDAPAALEAAHVVRHADGGNYETSNGILLRADLHTLFDLGLLGFDPVTGRALLHKELAGTTYERELAGSVLRAPTHESARPDARGLRRHNSFHGLSELA